MNRNLGVVGLVLAAIAAFAFSTPADAAVPASTQLRWRTSAANAAGYVDSLTAACNGAIGTSGTVDTTAWFSTADFDWAAIAGGAPATTHGAFRIAFSGTNVAMDTLFVAVEASADGVNPCSNTTFVGLVGVSGEDYLSGVVTANSATQGTVGAATVWMQPFLRLRVRADGNTAAVWNNLKARIHYLKRGQ